MSAVDPNFRIISGADGEIRTPESKGHRISNPAQYQAMRRLQRIGQWQVPNEPCRCQRPHAPGLHHAGRPLAASGWVRPMNRIMMIMKNAGNNAVIVRIPESGSP